jgi:hypothetical protein
VFLEEIFTNEKNRINDNGGIHKKLKMIYVSPETGLVNTPTVLGTF